MRPEAMARDRDCGSCRRCRDVAKGEKQPNQPPSQLLEVVAIDLGDLQRSVRHPDAMFDHESRQARAVDQDDAVRHLVRVVPRFSGERARCNEHALLCSPASECPKEALNLGSAYAVLPTLRLDVNFL